MLNDPDGELLDRLSKTEGFFEGAILRDDFRDWTLAKDFGEFVIRIAPDEILGHALVARACRHLGEQDCASEEIRKTKSLFKNGTLAPMDVDIFGTFLDVENLYFHGS